MILKIAGHAALAATVFAASPALARDSITNRPSIVVTGEGKAEELPDSFILTANLEGRGRTQTAALQQVATSLTTLTEAMPRLDGLVRPRLTYPAPSVEPAFAPGCGGTGYERDTSDCPIVGYVAAVQVRLEAGPAERAGDAASLAAEKGAHAVSFGGFVLSDRSGLERRARQAAFADARVQADTLAETSGQRVVRILRIQDPSARDGREDMMSVEEIVVTGSRIRSAIAVPVAPAPVSVSARVSVAFEIE